MSPTIKKKSAAKKTVKKKVAKKKVATTKKKAVAKKARKNSEKPSSLDITSEERWKMIAVTAYHKAEKRGFIPGDELQDWAESEKEIDKLLGG